MSASKGDCQPTVKKTESAQAASLAGQGKHQDKSETPSKKRGSKHRENQHKRKRSKSHGEKRDAVSILLEDSEPETPPPENATRPNKKNKSLENKHAVTQKPRPGTAKEESKTNEKDLLPQIRELVQGLERLKAKGRAGVGKQSSNHISEMNRLHVLLTDLLFTRYFLQFPEEETVQTKDRRLWKARRTLFLHARESRS